MKPSFERLWAAFPDHTQYPTLADLYSSLGGTVAKNINVQGFGPNGNTCASRMSVAFNHGGAPITEAAAHAVGVPSVGASDGSRVIYSVSGFRTYLLRILGAPKVDDASPYDDKFRGRKGIIAFSVHWHDATGHIALWNVSTYREPSHDDYSVYINSVDSRVRTSRGEFWELQ